MKKRFLSLLTAIVLCLPFLGTVTWTTGAVPAQDVVASGAARDPLPDGTVFVNINWTPANLPQEYSVDGKAFALSWGKNAFGNAQTAVDAAPKYGTVYLCPGALTASFTIKKSLTVLGAKYGLDPNVRGEREKDLWTLNSDRGSHETMLAARIYLGANSSTVFEEATEITVDGIMIGGKGELYSYNGSEGRADLHLKNLLLRDVAVTTSVLFLAPYQPSEFANTYKRFVTIENMRVEGLTTAPVLRLNADRADISGVYVDPDSTTTFLSDASASNGPDDEVVWNIHDNMFASPTARGIYLNWDNPSSNGVSLSVGVPTRTKIVNNVYRNIFVDNYTAVSESANSTISFRLKTQNVYFNIENNVFYQTREPVAGHMSINGYCDYAQRKDFSDQIKVENNRFIGNIDIAYYFKNTTSAVDVSGNFILDGGTVTAMPLDANSSAAETWHWLDAAMTVRSDSGSTPAIVSAPAAVNAATVTACGTLPDRTVFVDQSWTSASTPASITVKGKTFALTWGVNAYADAAAAVDAAHRFDTVYLCPGTYSAGFVIKKSLTLLGAGYGADPNVKGVTDDALWARNAARGSGETILSAVVNLGVDMSNVYEDILNITLDGIMISGAGQLRSNNGTAGVGQITLKNMYLKDSTLTAAPLYLIPYWPSGFPNTYKRFVTIRDLRVEGQNKEAVLSLTAERADISGVYMDAACTKQFLPHASASNGPSTEAVWNIHDNMLVTSIERAFYLNWDNPSSNSVSLSAGVATRTKLISNVYRNTFLGNTVSFRLKTENVYLHFENNFFKDSPSGSETIYGYTASKKNYSDQITVRNNRFINTDWPYYFKNNSVPVDISGNYTCNSGTVIAAPIHENSAATQSWHWTDAAMKIRSDDLVTLRAPVEVSYQMDQFGTGRADGTVTVTLPAGHNAEDIYLYWGNAGGRLAGYTALAPFKVSGNVVRNRMRSGSVIPQGATKLLAYSFSKKDGMSESFASFDLPEGAAIGADNLGTLDFEFQSVGDIHVTRTNTGRFHHSEHMRAMLEDIKAVSPASVAIINNGDTADRGADIDYEEFLRIVAEYDDLPTVYSGFGNHETFRYGVPPTDGNFADIKQAYYDYLSSSIPADASFSGGSRLSSLSFAFWKNGHKFIFLGMDVLNQNKIELNSTTLAWLKDQLDENRDPSRPTFIIMHQQFDGVTEDRGDVQPATETALRALLVDYPEAIMFNGHTHSNMYEELSYYQGDDYLPGGVFNCGSVGYVPRNLYRSRTDLNDSNVASQGYYVYVYGDKVVIKGRDFLAGQWIASAQYVVDISDGGPDKTTKTVKAPYYGKTTASPIIDDGKISGAVNCFLPTAHNATAVALYFANADTGIIGDQPFATCDVADQHTEQNLAVGFSEVTLPANADNILVYAYSDTLGWSANCDVVDLAEFADSGAAYADGNVSQSGRIKSDKKIYRLGEPIYVTATMETDGDWVGMQLASVTSGSFLNYQLNVAGSNVPVDVTNHDSLLSWGKFQQVTTGEWQIGWIPSTGATFQTAKTAENLITITIIDNGAPRALGTPAYAAEKMFSLLLDEGSVGKMISVPKKYKILWQVEQSQTGPLWGCDPDIKVLEYGISYAAQTDALASYVLDASLGKDVSGYSGRVVNFRYAYNDMGLTQMYGRYSFLIRNVSENKSRSAVPYVIYERDGEVYEEYGEIHTVVTLPGSFIHSTGPTSENGDELDD